MYYELWYIKNRKKIKCFFRPPRWSSSLIIGLFPLQMTNGRRWRFAYKRSLPARQKTAGCFLRLAINPRPPTVPATRPRFRRHIFVWVSARAFPIDIAFCFAADAAAAARHPPRRRGRFSWMSGCRGSEREEKTRTPRAPTVHKRIYHAKSFATVISTSLTAHAVTSSLTKPHRRRRRHHHSRRTATSLFAGKKLYYIIIIYFIAMQFY